MSFSFIEISLYILIATQILTIAAYKSGNIVEKQVATGFFLCLTTFALAFICGETHVSILAAINCFLALNSSLLEFSRREV